MTCICEGRSTDGRTVACELCDTWYHFDCIGLTVPQAEELELYICERCEVETGSKSIMFWEGIEVIPAFRQVIQTRGPTAKTVRTSRHPRIQGDSGVDPLDDTDSSASDIGVPSYYSDSSGTNYTESDYEASQSSLAHKTLRATSKTPSYTASDPFQKSRKSLTQKQKADLLPGPSKRPKIDRPGAASASVNDPARKYCLAQLEAVFLPIFTDHRLSVPAETRNPSDRAMTYARQVELHLFEHFAETDRIGTVIVGHKYKTQFRMLKFNLEKADRQTLRQRIAADNLTARELSLMTNADLASDQQKKEIEHAHQESLQHSILDAHGIDRPLRKITHKGEEEIEDMSKVEKDSTIWSGRAADGGQSDPGRRVSGLDVGRQKNDMSLPVSSMNMTGPQASNEQSTPESTPLGGTVHTLSDDSHPYTSGPASSGSAVAIGPDSPDISTLFDVNTISWSPRAEDVELSGTDIGGSPLIMAADQLVPSLDESEDNQTFDHDFNDLLELDISTRHPSSRDEAVSSTVWIGDLRMPTAPGQSVVVSVEARLLGGRPSHFHDPEFWSNLFRLESLVIEGRVPIGASESYLLNSRLNSGRELVAVSFAPRSNANAQYEELCQGLLLKGRHAVVLPWGNPPAADAPGKELYLVPLKPADQPEFLEMLDHLSLPSSRSSTLLVGVFILHRAKKLRQAPPVSVGSALMPTLASVSSPSLPSALPGTLGFDLSALTPEFIADLLKTNPAISAAAAAVFATPANEVASLPSPNTSVRHIPQYSTSYPMRTPMDSEARTVREHDVPRQGGDYLRRGRTGPSGSHTRRADGGWSSRRSREYDQR